MVKATSGPAPGAPGGGCGSRPAPSSGSEPKISVRMRSGATPQLTRPAERSRTHGVGPHTKELDRHGRVTSREGTWRAGVHGAKPGIFMPADPRVGQSFRQEYLKGHADDQFKIVSFHATVRVPAVSSHRAMKTQEWTPLEPGVRDEKFYVRGKGIVLEQTVRGGNERWELLSVRR